MSFDDRIGCTPQLVTACVALAVAGASAIYIGKENKKENIQIEPARVDALERVVEAQTALVNSGVQR